MDCRVVAEIRDVHISVAVIRLVPREIRLIPHAERERQARLDLELVLEEELVFPCSGRAARLAKEDAELVETAEEEIGHCIAAVDGSERDAAALGELGVQLPIDLMQLVAPLQG